MPLPLQKPLMRTSASPILAVRVAPLGKVSVVMMPRAAASHASGAKLDCSAGSASTIRSNGSCSPITPVEATKTRPGLAADQGGGGLGGGVDGGEAGLSGEHVGIAGIDHQRAGMALGQRRAAPVHRGARALVAGEHAGDGGAGGEFRHHQVSPALVADAGLGRAQPDARDWRKGRQRDGERRDRRLGHYGFAGAGGGSMASVARGTEPSGLNCSTFTWARASAKAFCTSSWIIFWRISSCASA